MGLDDPAMGAMAQLEYVLKGLKRKSSTPRWTRLPILPEMLRELKEVWQRHPNKKDARMLWAAATMCFFGFLRVGEIVIPSDSGFDPSIHLTPKDVKVSDLQDPRWLVVRIKASKTDPFRQGVSIYLGRTRNDLCPVSAVLGYMVQRGMQDGPFFRFEKNRGRDLW